MKKLLTFKSHKTGSYDLHFSPDGKYLAATGDDVGRSVAVSLYQGQPHVWYYDATSHALRHGWWTGAG